jgi:hypothetical protein
MGSNRILTSRGRFVRRQVREAGVHNHKNILVKKWKTFKGDNRSKIYKQQFEINLASCL